MDFGTVILLQKIAEKVEIIMSAVVVGVVVGLFLLTWLVIITKKGD